jgi:hypothetical protein
MVNQTHLRTLPTVLPIVMLAMPQVLLNLALLAINTGDGGTALRCCEEVLEQEGASPDLTQPFKQKALLRWGGGLVE